MSMDDAINAAQPMVPTPLSDAMTAAIGAALPTNGRGAPVTTADVVAVRFPLHKIERIELEGDYAGLWVAMHTNPSAEDQKAAWVGDENLFTGLVYFTKAWNIGTPETGPYLIQVETFRRLPMKLVQQIADAWQELALGIPRSTLPKPTATA